MKSIYDHLAIEQGDIPLIDELVAKYGKYLEGLTKLQKNWLLNEITSSLETGDNGQIPAIEGIDFTKFLNKANFIKLGLVEALTVQLRAGVYLSE
ncbi:MAG TPA: hypothetical protein VK203_07820 [Nostocaceae cyanobacterium]|nr:hypothetical protein [Nostocaceae cyanobacterium]